MQQCVVLPPPGLSLRTTGVGSEGDPLLVICLFWLGRTFATLTSAQRNRIGGKTERTLSARQLE